MPESSITAQLRLRNTHSDAGYARHEVAILGAGLWEALGLEASEERKDGVQVTGGGSEEAAGLCVECSTPREAGRGGRGRKRRRLVTWGEMGHNMGVTIDVAPTGWLGPISTKTRLVQVSKHQPLVLDSVVLQPLEPDQSQSSDDLADILSSLYSVTPPRILRQGDVWSTVEGNEKDAGYRILLTSPVLQGIAEEGSTKFILAPYEDSGAMSGATHVNGNGNGSYRESRISPSPSISGSKATHLSILDEFDSDSFLSAALELGEDFQEEEEDEDETVRAARWKMRKAGTNGDSDEWDPGSISASSGSITPRPLNRASASPVANGDAWEHEQERVLNGSVVMPPVDEQVAVRLLGGTKFTAVPLEERMEDDAFVGKANGGGKMNGTGDVDGRCLDDEARCWLNVAGLARAGVFADDWILIRCADDESGSSTRLLQVKVLEDDEIDEDDEADSSLALLLPPALLHNLTTSLRTTNGSTPLAVILSPIPSGHRLPALPTAQAITLARIASPHSVDKAYEKAFTAGLKAHFESSDKQVKRLLKRGDVIMVPVAEISGGGDTGSDEDDDEEEEEEEAAGSSALVFFLVTDMQYDPLVPLEEDFHSSVPSKCRAGELGCWVDPSRTKMLTLGLEHGRAVKGSKAFWGIAGQPDPFASSAAVRLRNHLDIALSPSSAALVLQLSILIKGARGSGKASLVKGIASAAGIHTLEVDCFAISEDTDGKTQGALEAAISKAQSCAPCILLLKHVEAFGRKSDAQQHGKESPLVVRLSKVGSDLKAAALASGSPVILVGTTSEEDALPAGTVSAFKQEISINAPSESERLRILNNLLGGLQLAPDVNIKSVATQTAALQAVDLVNLVSKAEEACLERLTKLYPLRSPLTLQGSIEEAGPVLSAQDFQSALQDARSAFSDSIGAPKIPNVSWDDVGGLASVKNDILDTIQLPLERPDLFADGLKKRSGVLLYGPPGTGKTLLAKAVATSCSLNFFSVKGPELLNMYIGESEANVRRVFQRARDAQPCVIFLDELDSVAPKRGNQGDSGGVMDRIVSQLLAELDGMGSGKGGAGVFVMAATNRPDLLDPALLRPGRFDRMLYLGVSTDHSTQLKIIQALTRKFKLDPDLDLAVIADQCPFNFTGADFYALCSDAMLKGMSRVAGEIDKKIELLNKTPEPHSFPHPLTPQYYLSTLATPTEVQVLVNKDDFERALGELVPSVSKEEMEHYARVQKQFSGETMNAVKESNGAKGKGKGKQMYVDGEDE